ncbi:MAG: beta-N-acetylglucosaminidase domain-containing protein [Bacteriovoracia bacterium]
MSLIGVIEGFFGPAWPESNRKSYARFLKEVGGDFYIYAPKKDPFLRKKWREEWSSDYVHFLQELISNFHAEGIKFGVGFSPFGLGTSLTADDKAMLMQKASQLEALGVDILGLFFDDMPVTEKLAETQLQTLDVVRKIFKGKIVFCPSFYTPDPVLDKVFGQRPPGYLDDLANKIPDEVAIAWTGPKVISPVIDKEHLRETQKLLRRKPYIWENLFANDGPRNCKFLKLKPFSGREKGTLEEAEAFGLNLMNQPELSKILFLASLFVLREAADPEEAFQKALASLCSDPFSQFLQQHRELFLTTGLDGISEEQKSDLLLELSACEEVSSHEVRDWLNGKYIVDSECLTD